MIRKVDCPASVILGRDELDVHVTGECFRAADKRIECRVTRVMLGERDITLKLIDEHPLALEALRTRLCCEYIASGVRNTPDESAAWNDDGPGGSAA